LFKKSAGKMPDIRENRILKNVLRLKKNKGVKEMVRVVIMILGQ